MKIAIGNDHACREMKSALIEHLNSKGIQAVDLGAKGSDSSDYPIYAESIARAVAAGEYDRGILICGTGIGMSIAANKVNGARAACCTDPYSSKLSREHNNSNILCLGARVTGVELAKMIVDTWLDAEFEAGRHKRRVDMYDEIENRSK